MEFFLDTIQRYEKLHDNKPALVVSAPGRVNLIGEHTDYNNGYVLPVAIDRSMFIAAGPREDDLLSLHSVDLQSTVTTSLSALEFDQAAPWSNYPKGVASQYQKRGYILKGANFCIRGNIPIASGLSSSAALEVASSIAFQMLNDLPSSLLEMVQLACKAENEFVGVQCGIMDQFISMYGKQHHALFLDCRDLTYRHVPFPENVRIVICDTGIKRELPRSAYNRREAECDEAVRQIQKVKAGIATLRDVSVEEFKELKSKLTPLAQRRAAHVISENERVLRSVDALNTNDMRTIGKLMVASHQSLRDDFEVSSKELNAFVDIATETDGVYGARMTGAGFGGCAICIVEEGKIDGLIERLKIEYRKQAGRSFTIYLTQPHDGASILYPSQSMIPRTLASRV